MLVGIWTGFARLLAIVPDKSLVRRIGSNASPEKLVLHAVHVVARINERPNIARVNMKVAPVTGIAAYLDPRTRCVVRVRRHRFITRQAFDRIRRTLQKPQLMI